MSRKKSSHETDLFISRADFLRLTGWFLSSYGMVFFALQTDFFSLAVERRLLLIPIEVRLAIQKVRRLPKTSALMKLWVYVDFLNRLTLFNGICRLLLFGEEEKEKGPPA